MKWLIIFIFCSFNLFAQDLSKSSYAQLDSLLLIEFHKGAYEAAIPYAEIGRDKALKEFGEMDSTFAEYTGTLGVLYHQIGQYPKAEQFFLQAIKIQKKVLGEQNRHFASNLNSLASLYQDMGNFEKAELYYLQSKDIRTKVLRKDHPDLANIFNDLGQFYYSTGNYEKAEFCFLQSKDIYEKAHGEEHQYFAMSLVNLAMLYLDMGQYEKSEPLLLQAKNIRAKVLGEDHPDFANSLHNLAALYYKMGQYKEVESLYLQSQKIWIKILGEEHPQVVSVMTNLAGLYNTTGRHKESETLHLKAVASTQKMLGEQHPTYANQIGNLAQLYKDIGQYEKAEQLYLQSINIRSKVFGEESRVFAQSLYNIAGFYRQIGKLDTALHYARLSIAANSAQIDDNTPNWLELDKFEYYSNEQINLSVQELLYAFIAKYHLTKDKTTLESCYQVATAAIHLNERIRNSFSGEGDKLRSLATNHAYVLQAIQAGRALEKKGYEAETFGFAEMNKGVLLMDAEKTASAHKFGDLPDSLATQEKLLQKKHSVLQAKLLENQPQTIKDSLLNLLNKTKQEIDVFSKTLKTKYPKYAALKYENKTATAAEVQALLDDKTALLEYVIEDSAVYIFYVDKQKVVLVQNILGSYLLSSKIKELHDVLSNYAFIVNDKPLAYQKYTANAYWFYEQLIAPVIKNAKGISNLIIVSDGELGHLPFEAFLVESAPQKQTDYKELHYLTNDYKISYNYSATIWKSAKNLSTSFGQKHTNNGQILAMAADYGIKLDDNKKDWRLPAHQRLRATLGELPEARKEIETLSEKFSGFFAFDKDASEKVFKEKSGDYAVIHLAMHGLLDAKGPILSSLAFTEDGDSVENNFLQAFEISKMKLNADLVVLSACETGYGRFDKGNGIASLAQAFAYAGAPAMVVTLWQVNDYATSEMMKNLYENLANGMKKDEALQQAKIQYLQKAEGIAAHPAFWSPFILMGNTDAIYLKTKGGWMNWALGGLAILGLGSIGLFWKKRKE